MFCLYEKVQRKKVAKKTKWQNLFRGGLMTIDDREFLFSEAQARPLAGAPALFPPLAWGTRLLVPGRRRRPPYP